MKLQDFNFEIKHKSGKKNFNIDTLSRLLTNKKLIETSINTTDIIELEIYLLSSKI
jgi:hypothetical protein